MHYTNTVYTNTDKSKYGTWVTLEPGYSVSPSYSGALPSDTFGMEIGAARVLNEYYENPAFIKVSRGGTALGVPGTDWYPVKDSEDLVGPLYRALIDSTKDALEELEAAGDTYTVHGVFWHQGESDINERTDVYGDLLATLIKNVRSDLNMPNLRFIVGEVATVKPLAFRTVQWEAARSLPNTSFISSRGLGVMDQSHFNTQAMTIYGERVGYAFLPNREILDFEIPIYATGPLDRQDEFAATDGVDSSLQVVATSSQGEYVSGQAAGHKGATGGHYCTRRHLIPLKKASTMQADFFPGNVGFDNQADADSSLLIAGWGVDADSDGVFTEAETAIGFGVYHTANFRIQIGSQTYLSTETYQTDHWYRLTLSWTNPNQHGQRTVELYVRDLSAGIDLNEGNPVISILIDEDDFDGNPMHWSGMGFRATRGLVDNISIMPFGFSAWVKTLFPDLQGGANGDDDHDGLSNSLEYAFGLDPFFSNSPLELPQISFGVEYASLLVSPLATQPNIHYTLQWSRDLESWTTLAGAPSNEYITFTLNTIGETTLFFRQLVEF